MSENWNFYHSKVDHKPAYIFFDVEVAKEVETQNYRFMSYVSVYLKKPNTDGLSTNEEFDKLCEIEDSLDNGLSGKCTVYVGRNTSDGCRDFYFYTAEPKNWAGAVDKSMASHPDFEYECGSREDPEWNVYFNFLYPTSRDWETIKSRSVCDNLYDQGDKLEIEREVDHWIYFENSLNREAFESKALNSGYKLRSKSEPDDEYNTYGIQVYHECVPSPYISLELSGQSGLKIYNTDNKGFSVTLVADFEMIRHSKS